MSSGGEEGVTCSSCLVVPVGPCSPELSDPLPTLCRMHSCVRDGEQALKPIVVLQGTNRARWCCAGVTRSCVCARGC